jgi:hypothetical protein
MKIGILTVHRAINFGAVLQCYALQETLRSLGHDVWVINYVQEKVERTDRSRLTWKSFWWLVKGLHLRSLFYLPRDYRNRKTSFANFDGFLDDFLHCTEPCDKDHIPQDFDAYVIGSDQLWNSHIFGYAEQVFWGNFPHAANSKVVAYAPSTSVQDLKKQDSAFIQRSLNNFDLLSTREKTVADYLNATYNTKVPVQTVLDPTLVADPKTWHSIKCDKFANEKYVFVFEARPCNGVFGVLQPMAERLAEKLGCKVMHISLHKHSPIDFLDIVRHASYVVTSSFHGVAFSLIYNRPLYAVCYGDEQDARYVDLLTNLGANSMLADVDSELAVQNIDYTSINRKMEELRQPSLNYLKQLK